ncbi:pyridoxal phosphate-dependent aminotransferase [Aquimarina sp. ERC-38]|uniref:pyridoxal phosphate-dependent aminotransferase n=1 Tax=Aquimarina sp. ERC-38 TaxID=2949996 RepID=UPI002245D42F|nr:pyridoxal phosphate-dependent aminotransferase [Aquimarina sp. ERC-38]UZO80570.1 pyridoxal phosphate-dependent aminotransferase [Aquimarina sp. ERC-38]
MPVVSQKGKAMPESPIRRLVPYAEKAKKKGIQVYHLNIGQPDVKTPAIAMDAVSNHNLEILAYSHSAGFESLRKKLAVYYDKFNIKVTADDILVTTGGSEALIFTMGSITDPGDEIIVPEPFYANYYSFSTQSTITVVPVISKIEDDFALPPIENFEKLINANTKAILICNPGNPTGYLYSKSEIKALAELAIKYDLFLISDEVYREFIYDQNEVHHSILQEPGLDQHAIVVDSFSKRYSMCGARIGCMVSKNKEVMQTAMKFAQARLSPPTFAQIASEAALDAPQSYYTDTVAIYKTRRDTLVRELQFIPGCQVAIPKGAFYCIAALPVQDANDFAIWLLDAYELNQKTVMIAPAAGFYSSPNEGLNQVRIAYVLEEASLIEAVRILKSALSVYLAKFPNKALSETV